MNGFFRKTAVVLACILVCSLPVLAVDEWPDDEFMEDVLTDEPVSVETFSDEKELTVNVYPVEIPLEVPVNVPVEVPVNIPEIPVASSVETDDINQNEPAQFVVRTVSLTDSFRLANVSPGDTIQAVLESLFGEYSPRTQTVTQYLSDGTSVESVEYVPGLAGMDWPWIASVSVFMLMLYCLFRLLGGVLSRV